MKIYNKLVRDKIPSIIEENNEICNVRVLSDEEYIYELNKKLQEEVSEYLESGKIEELADIEEVLRALLDTKSCKYEDFECIRQSKAEKRGAFKDKLFLESVSSEHKK